jgi:hypothetical protein
LKECQWVGGKNLRQGGKRDSAGLDQGQEGKYDARILGSGAFVEKVLGEDTRVKQKRALKKRRVGIGELVDAVGKVFGVHGGEVIAGSRRHAVSLARSVVCYLGSRDLGMTGRELSRELDLTPATIHYAIMRGNKYLDENEKTEEKIGKYLKFLTTSIPSPRPQFPVSSL